MGPTYHDLGEHAEVLQVEFDPTQLSFEALLTMFWASHNPARDGRRSQYRSILVCEDERQFAIADKSRSKVERTLGRKVLTEVVAGKVFYPAEGYHQKWQLRRRAALYEELAKSFDSEESLLRSFAATKLNAIAGGYLRWPAIAEIAHHLSLSDDGLLLLEGISTSIPLRADG